LQVQTLTKELQDLSHLPLFIGIDEEGGRVSRVGRLFDSLIPPAYNIGRQGNPALAYDAARTIGSRLVLLGINMNFAPVADIWSNPANTVIGNRAFGRDLNIVGDMVEAAVKGFTAEGVLSVIKHFPGHGDTNEDSHFQLAFYYHNRERFDQMEVVPFIRGIQAGTDGVMIGHISTPAFQYSRQLKSWMAPWIESGKLPATFSDFWLQEVLRNEMGFDGLIITDSLQMKALTDHFTSAQIVVGAFLAGSDILLMPANPHTAFQALLDAYHSGLFDEERLNQSVRRILQAKLRHFTLP
jgi:beta-N-acetylhexosaminidase